MGNKLLLFSLSIMAVLFLSSFVAAEIIISQPETIYNLGAEMNVNFEVDQIQEDYFNVDLICTGERGGTQNLYHGILTEKGIIISRKLIPAFINGLRGKCYLEASYNNDRKTSQIFEISDKIRVELEITELNYKAGEQIYLKGKATRDDGKIIEDSMKTFAEISLASEAKATATVKGGVFELNFSTSETMPAQTYPLLAFVYDKDENGNILNKGEARADLIIHQIPSSIEIAIDKQFILPGESLTLIPFLYDKAGSSMMNEEALLKINDSEGKIMYEKIVKTGEQLSVKLEYNHAPGYSTITLKKGDIIGRKTFDVEESPKLNMEIKNDSLIVTNIGNVPYDREIEISIGNKTIVKEISLELGETKKYAITAPEGEYSLIVKDEYGIIQEGKNVALTGGGIGVNEVGGGIGVLSKYPIVWAFILIIIALAILLLYRNNKQKRAVSAYSFPFGKKPDIKKNTVLTKKLEHEDNWNISEKEENIMMPGTVTKAEHVLVLDGQKNNAGIVAIKIKGVLSKLGKDTLSRSLEEVRQARGAICQMGNSILFIFSPLVTKTFKNEETAVKIALKIDGQLKEHNRRFKDKIGYGIGINSGEIINKVDKEILKFTSLGNAVNFARRIADLARDEVLLSKSVHQKTATDIKVEKVEKKEIEAELFRVKRIIDNEQANKFVQDFLRRK